MALVALAAQSRATVAPVVPVAAARAVATAPRESTRLLRALMVAMVAVPESVVGAATVAPADALRVRALPVSAALPAPVAGWAMQVTVDVALTVTLELRRAAAVATVVQVAARALRAMVAPAEMAGRLSLQALLVAPVEPAAQVERMRPASLVLAGPAVLVVGVTTAWRAH